MSALEEQEPGSSLSEILMDERQDSQEPGSIQGAEQSHWNQLAESLGVKVPAEPTARPTNPVTPIGSTEKQKKLTKDRSAKPQPPKSHWRKLASMLGIGGVPEEQTPDEDMVDAIAERQASDEPEAQGFAREVEPRREPGKMADGGSSPAPAGRSAEPPESQPGTWVVPVAEPQPVASGHGTDLPDSSGNISALGLEFEPDDDDLSRSKAQSVLESLFQPSPTAFWEEMDSEQEQVTSIRFERHEDVEFLDEELDRGSETVEDESRDRPERTGRGRRGRSRRRRRRGRPQEAASADVLESGFTDEPATPSDSTLRLEASADLFDKTADEEEHEPSSEYDLEMDAIPEGGSREPGSDRGRDKKRITSWEEAISVIVERNLQNRPASHKPGGPSRPPKGRRRQ